MIGNRKGGGTDRWRLGAARLRSRVRRSRGLQRPAQLQSWPSVVTRFRFRRWELNIAGESRARLTDQAVVRLARSRCPYRILAGLRDYSRVAVNQQALRCLSRFNDFARETPLGKRRRWTGSDNYPEQVAMLSG